jgi:hypothetical protein
MEDQDSDVSSEVDEETVARERAALREAMGTGPQPVPPTIPIPSRLGVEGGGATWPHGGGGSGDDDGDDDDDDDLSDDSETIAQERAALQRAMASEGHGFSTMGSTPATFTSTSTSTSAPNPNRLGALALQRALMANLAYQRLCHEELAAINRVLALHEHADAERVQGRAAPQNAHEALLAASSIPGTFLGEVAPTAPGVAPRHAAHGGEARAAWQQQPAPPAPASYRPEGAPFFLEVHPTVAFTLTLTLTLTLNPNPNP